MGRKVEKLRHVVPDKKAEKKTETDQHQTPLNEMKNSRRGWGEVLPVVKTSFSIL